MPQTRDCDYCGAEIEPGTGTMFVQVNGAVTHYCSSKCEKNAGLDREPRDLEWTASGQIDSDTADTSASPEPADSAADGEPENGGEADASEVADSRDLNAEDEEE